MLITEALAAFAQDFAESCALFESRHHEPETLVYVGNRLLAQYEELEDLIPDSQTWETRQEIYRLQSQMNRVIDACEHLLARDHQWD